MGHFLAVTAVRAKAPRVSAAIVNYCGLHSLPCAEATVTDPDERTDVLLFSQDEWTLVLWPEYFNVHDFPVARHLSEQLGTLVSTVNVHDDACWCHGLFDNGKLVDRFASDPEFIELDPADWAGNAEVVASAFGVPPAAIAPYFTHPASHADLDVDFDLNPDVTLREVVDLDAKAHPDDEFPLADFWVFCDFWRRCSIAYPSDMSAFTACLRLGKNFANRLPTND